MGIMALSRIIKCGLILVAFLFLFTGLASSTSISEGIFASQISIERRLLQARKPCTIDFEHQNYTIITSKCKGPRYTANLCCTAFKEFACPFVDQVNDATTDCARTMFSYISLYGKYPPGLFANECKESKSGLECPESPQSSEEASSGNLICNLFPATASLVLLLYFM